MTAAVSRATRRVAVLGVGLGVWAAVGFGVSRAGGPGTSAAPLPYEQLVPTTEEVFGWVERIHAQGIRRAGHPADLWVEEFAREHLEAYGCQDVQKQPVPLDRWFEGDTELRLHLGDRFVDMMAFPFAFVKWAERVEAPVMKYTGDADLEKVEGKVVVVDYPLNEMGPVYHLPSATWFYDPDRNLLDTWHVVGMPHVADSGATVSKILARRPAAVIAVLTNYFESPFLWGVHGADFGRGGLSVPCVFVSPANGRRLDGYLAAGPVKATLEVNGRAEDVVTHNVMGTLPGASDEIILVASHHDGPFYSAAEDAAGVALVLAQAAYWSRVPQAERPHTMVFLFTSAHLKGALGERVLLKEMPGFADRILLDVHLETPCIEHAIEENRLVNKHRPEPRWIYTSRIPVLEEALKQAIQAEDLRRTMVLPPDVFGGHPRSGAGHFHQAGVPVASFLSSPSYYFDIQDTPDKVDREGLVPITRTMIRTIWAMKGQTAAGMRAADLQRIEPGEDTNAKNRRFLLTYDTDGDGKLNEAERAVLRADLEKRFYGR